MAFLKYRNMHLGDLRPSYVPYGRENRSRGDLVELGDQAEPEEDLTIPESRGNGYDFSSVNPPEVRSEHQTADV